MPAQPDDSFPTAPRMLGNGGGVETTKESQGLEARVAQLSAELSACLASRERSEDGQRRLLAILDSLEAIVYVADLQSYELLYLNNYAKKLFGDRVGELCWRVLQKGQSGPCPFCTNARLLDGGGKPCGPYIWEFENTRTGQWFYINDKAIAWVDGRLVRLEIATDISARKVAERALLASEEQYRAIFDAAQDGFFIMALDGRIIEVNSALCRQHGYSREELLALPPLAAVHPDYHKFFPPMLRELNRGRPFSQEGCHLRKDGSTFPVEVHLSPFAYQGAPHIFGLVRDISERKRAEEEKRLLEAKLRQSQKMEAIGTLAGGIAHDFNNILTAILGYSDLAAYLLPAESPVREHIKAVSRAGIRAKDLVKQILAFSRQAEQARKPIEISPVVKEVLKLLRASLPTTIEIRQEIGAGLGAVLADPTQIHQILLNLCANAADAMEPAGGQLTVELCAHQGALPGALDDQEFTDSWVRLSVRDTGKGIPLGSIERIFDPFYTTKEKGKGTGLGLSVVHGIVQSHDGKITVESTPGLGSTFHVFFPVVPLHASALVPDTSPPAMGSGRILLVDDEAEVVALEKEMLESLGYSVTAFTSSVELLARFKERSAEYDLVITDQTMPVLPGATLIAELRKIRPEIPVVLCTGYSAVIDEAKAESLGVREFLMKPFDIRQLALAVQRALGA